MTLSNQTGEMRVERRGCRWIVERVARFEGGVMTVDAERARDFDSWLESER